MYSLDFENIKFTKIDLDWFNILSPDEKIIFMYDLIFDNSINLTDIKSKKSQKTSPRNISELYTELICNSTNYEYTKIIFVRNYIIINSDSLLMLAHAKHKLMEDGFLLTQVKEKKVYSGGFKYTSVYEISCNVSPVCLN